MMHIPTMLIVAASITILFATQNVVGASWNDRRGSGFSSQKSGNSYVSSYLRPHNAVTSSNPTTANKFVPQNNEILASNYTEFVLSSKQDFFPIALGMRGFVKISGFPKLPAGYLRSQVEDDIQREYDYFERVSKLFINSEIAEQYLSNVFFGDFERTYKDLIQNKRTVLENSLSTTDVSEDPVLGYVIKNSYGNPLQSTLQRELVCKKKLIEEGFISDDEAWYVHVGDYCDKYLVLKHAIALGSHPREVATSVRVFKESYNVKKILYDYYINNEGIIPPFLF